MMMDLVISEEITEVFNKAVVNPNNMTADGSINWNFVDADLHLTLGKQFSASYLDNCFNTLANRFMNRG